MSEAPAKRTRKPAAPKGAAAVPAATQAVATDKIVQVIGAVCDVEFEGHLPAIMNVQGWFGTLEECVDAAVTGTWRGEHP